MHFIVEFLFQALLEFLAYGIGRGVLFLVAPRCRSELELNSAARDSWKWRGWSFARHGQRYLYVESIQLIGLVTAAALAALAWWLTTRAW